MNTLNTANAFLKCSYQTWSDNQRLRWSVFQTSNAFSPNNKNTAFNQLPGKTQSVQSIVGKD